MRLDTRDTYRDISLSRFFLLARYSPWRAALPREAATVDDAGSENPAHITGYLQNRCSRTVGQHR